MDNGAAVEASRESQSGRFVPRSTYRVQLNAGFTFDDARAIVPYLADLGVGALYASPYLKATPGSSHGYDVVDYGALNPEIGDEAAHAALVGALRERGMGHLVDFVPNHMGIAEGGNAWWLDVLENGQTSPYADFFDIDWRPLKPELRGKVLLPILGDHYGVVLEKGELELGFADGAFTVCYYATPLPIAPPTYPTVLRLPLPELAEAFAPDDPAFLEYQSIVTAFERLAPQDEPDPDLVAERRREQIVARRRLAELVADTPVVAEAIEAAVRAFNGTADDARSFDLLDGLLGEQTYRLSSFRTAAEEINYRRFFAINELASVRQEVPAVFAAAHALLLRLIAEEKVDGVRIDHPDGLWDPAGYFQQLQEAVAQVRLGSESDAGTADADGAAGVDAAPGGAGTAEEPPELAVGGDDPAIYLLVEKILEPGEELPADWAVAGTVGYEFARLATGLFVDPVNRKAFDDLYARFIGHKIDFADLVYQKKKLILRTALASEANVLARALNRISEHDRRTRDFTLSSLRDALRETIACFPVYRTYIVCEEGGVPDRDRRFIERATALAKKRNPATDPSVFDFLRDVLLLRNADDATEPQRADACRFGMKFQQLTGPVMAKGLEDTAFYVYNRLVSLNEVGGDPAAFGVVPAEFHRQNAARRRRWPRALLTSSTHDTKRSEDVRARIDVLSELPREWRAALNRWARLNRRQKTRLEDGLAPDRNDEYLFYQTLLGAWPFGAAAPDAELVDRVAAYMLKAVREAQVQTAWVNPNEAYEAALSAFVRGALDTSGAKPNPFLDDLAALRRTIDHVGAGNALAQQLLKLTAPGVPDIYQGTELWDQSLVDPDNRRPVDFPRRRAALDGLRRRKPSRDLAEELLATKADGRIKLWLTHRALNCRRDWPELFAEGDYVPLEATGAEAEHVVAFARRQGDLEAVVVLPRLIAGLLRGKLIDPLGAEVWGDTRLPISGAAAGQRYRNAFTGSVVEAAAGSDNTATLALADIFAALPFALVVREADDGDGAERSA
ncbi:MAG: malto-oligosyltrehalose synthase [Chloroflexia bacterium]|nr:malto-oligosyltrehalose synthase [Chloroflexia bacterium]